MAHDNTVSFKVFLKKSGSDEKAEVRRFGIDRDVVSNFSYLKEKLHTVFPSLLRRDITVSWKDDEGDEIIISSDDELIIALTEMQSDVRKLYVSVNDATRDNSPSQGTCHVGITCDGCDKNVEGFRYKCIQCDDFDLCANCEGKGKHNEHFMIRLPIPVSWRPQFGRRLAHHLSKSSRKYCPTSGSGAGECPWRDQRHGSQIPFLDILGSYLNTFANPSPAEGKDCEKKQNEATTSQDTSGTSNTCNDSHRTFLMNVGKTVAEILDPLGIDVEVSVSDKNNTTKVNSEEKQSQKEKSPTRVHFAKEDDTTKSGETTKNVTQDESTTVEENKNEVSGSPRSSSERESPETDGWTVLNQESQQNQSNGTTLRSDESEITGATNIPSTPSINEAVENAAHAAATSAASAAAAAAMARAATTGAVPKNICPVFPPPVAYSGQPFPVWNQYLPNMYPTLPEALQMPAAPLPFLHRDPKIADAVQKMMAMGFSNEGGWLTQLLEIKKGDIEKALDVLQPVKK